MSVRNEKATLVKKLFNQYSSKFCFTETNFKKYKEKSNDHLNYFHWIWSSALFQIYKSLHHIEPLVFLNHKAFKLRGNEFLRKKEIYWWVCTRIWRGCSWSGRWSSCCTCSPCPWPSTPGNTSGPGTVSRDFSTLILGIFQCRHPDKGSTTFILTGAALH